MEAVSLSAVSTPLGAPVVRVLRHHAPLAAMLAARSITALQSPARTWHDIKWTPASMRYYATRPPKDAPANNQTTFVACVKHFLVKRRRALLYVAYFALGVAPAKAVHHDKWTALRQKPADLGGIRTRRRRAQAISQFAGHRLFSARRGARGTHAAGAGQVFQSSPLGAIGNGCPGSYSDGMRAGVGHEATARSRLVVLRPSGMAALFLAVLGPGMRAGLSGICWT